MLGTLRVVNAAFLVLAIVGCRILGILDEPVKIRTAFVSYSATHTGDSLPVWAGAKVSFTVTTWAQNLWSSRTTNCNRQENCRYLDERFEPRKGRGGRDYPSGATVARHSRLSHASPVVAGRGIRSPVAIGSMSLWRWRSNKVATGPMSYTEPFVIVEE